MKKMTLIRGGELGIKKRSRRGKAKARERRQEEERGIETHIADRLKHEEERRTSGRC